MKSFQGSTTINAPPEKVWAALTDSEHFTNWDTQMISISGTIAPQEKLTIYSTLASNRTFNVVVSEFEPHKKMVWSSGMPLGLFDGKRTFTLEAVGDNQTKITTQEVFKGLLLPLFGRTIPDMNPVFETFCNDLKKHVESM